MAKKSSADYIKHQLQAATKVLSWWRTKAGGLDEGLGKMVNEWLPILSLQVKLPTLHSEFQLPKLPYPPGHAAWHILCMCEQAKLVSMGVHACFLVSSNIASHVLNDWSAYADWQGHSQAQAQGC